jgi:hypothetical protein
MMGTAGLVVVVGGMAAMWVVDHHERRTVSDDEVVASRQFLTQLNSSGNDDTAMRNLERYGVTIVRQVLNGEEVELWKQRVRHHCPCQPPPNNNDTAMIIPPGTVYLDGRLHYHVASTIPFHHELARLGGERWERGKHIRNSTPADNEAATTTTSSSSSSQLIRLVQRFFHQKNHSLTQLQLLNAVPSSTTTHQIWHRDNTEPGVTAIVALTPITAHHGPTELIIGSHRQQSILLALWRALLMGGGSDDNGGGENNEDHFYAITQLPESQHLLALLDAGDAILYDARCLHRGRGNDSYHHTIDEKENHDHDHDHHDVDDRPVLVLRWDADLTPPPGGGLIPTALARYGGYIYSLTLYGQAAYQHWKKQQ